ncbi:MAG TPA: HsdR family type I site-specific deoxyribonuclease, partial [bacterium]|nr:HsdR family type I site-specific deoxyribonuclease [bacterium]
VDRNELESQLFGNLAALGIENVEVAESKKHLQNLLSRDRRGLIVTMIHKFEDMPENINLRKNIFVLVDEAHRTTGGKLGNFLMGAIPNATYIGFTGTPIDKTSYGRGTFITFGRDDPPKGYLDKYSIAESIEDGTTVPLYYTLAPNELQVDKEVLEKEFLDLAEAEGMSDIEELNKVLDKAVTLKNMLKNRERVEKVTRYIVDHYQKYIEPMGYKAFVVAVDREACALYKEELDKYLPPDYSKVVYSPFYNDPPELSRYHLSEIEEKRIRNAFRKPDELPKILIVTEKLLTGFDAPILYCMYLDKPMRDHVLLQAIARVNRPYEDDEGRKKSSGFVLDFVGIFDNLEKALAFDSQDIEGIVQDVEVLKKRFAEEMKKAREKYLTLIEGKTPDKAFEAVLEYFRDEEKRKEFYKFFKELSAIYEIISPDAFLRPYVNDYETLTRMYKSLIENYERGIPIDREFTRKTA